MPTRTADRKKPVLPELYKTKLCEKFEAKGTCKYRGKCMFAHGEADLRTKEMNARTSLPRSVAIKRFQREHEAALRVQQRNATSAKATTTLAGTKDAAPLDLTVKTPPPPATPLTDTASEPPTPEIRRWAHNPYAHSYMHVESASSSFNNAAPPRQGGVSSEWTTTPPNSFASASRSSSASSESFAYMRELLAEYGC